MYKNILLAVDGSEHSLRATTEAVKIASLVNDCAIEVAYVVDYSKSKDDVLHSKIGPIIPPNLPILDATPRPVDLISAG